MRWYFRRQRVRARVIISLWVQGSVRVRIRVGVRFNSSLCHCGATVAGANVILSKFFVTLTHFCFLSHWADGKYDDLLDNLVDEIRDQVDKLSSKIMRQIEGGKSESAEDDTSSSSSSSASDTREAFTNPDMTADASSSNGYFIDQPLEDVSSSLPVGLNGEGPSSLVEADIDASSSALSVGQEEETMSDVDLLNAIRDISQGMSCTMQSTWPTES